MKPSRVVKREAAPSTPAAGRFPSAQVVIYGPAMTEPLLAHTATKLADARGRVVVCGSHGGSYAGLLAVAAGVRAILLNDAGVGLDEAGIAALGICEAAGIPAATLAHTSCRIGDAEDSFARGLVSFVNGPAAALGVTPGMTARDAAGRLAAAPEPVGEPPAMDEEHRRVETVNGWRVVVIDSVSLVRAGEDDGAIVVTASHGGLVGGDPASAGRADAALFGFNDAGVGRDAAGTSRLPVLERRGIPAVTVDCRTARIGDGASTLETGIVSHANAPAIALGAAPGVPLAALVAGITARQRKDTP